MNASNLPYEQTTEVTTNVVVKDGQTILIGGLFRETDTNTRAQVPLLGDIPALGTLFQSRSDTLRRSEVIILLTVHIVKNNDAYAEESKKQFEDIERIRVGIREGQMWHGRERVAQALYKKALDYITAGKEDKARWCLRMALYNNPRFLSAIQLQEELRSKREWDDDGTVTRDFIQQIIMKEQGIDESIFDRPEVLRDSTDKQEELEDAEADSGLREKSDVQG